MALMNHATRVVSFFWEVMTLCDSEMCQACFVLGEKWPDSPPDDCDDFPDLLLAPSLFQWPIQLKKLVLIIVATTLRWFVLQFVCAISRWCVVQFSRVSIFSLFYSGDLLYLSWSFRQIHPFTWSSFVASSFQLFHWWRGIWERWDVGVLVRVWEGFFCLFFFAGPRLPSHVLQRLLGLFRVYVVLPCPWAEVQVCGPLGAALLVAREEAKPAGTNRRQSVC